jgi:ABC-type bacteriocin/lantibiotic exporter with double-glycine peptidase domain
MKTATLRAWRHYARYYRQMRLTLLAYAALSVVPALLPLALAWVIRYGFDEALPSHNLTVLSLASGGILLLTLTSSAITLWTRRLALNLTKTVTRRLREHLLQKAYAMPRSDYASADRAKLSTIVVHDTERVDTMSQALAIQVFPAVAVSAVLAALLLYLNPALCLLIGITLPVAVVLSEVIRRRIVRSFSAYRRDFQMFSRGVLFVLQMLDLAHVQAAEAFELKRQQARLETVSGGSARVGWLNVAYGEVLNVVVSLTSVLILVVGGNAVVGGSMTLGSLLSFYVGVGLLANALRPAWNTIPQLISGSESLKALHLFLESGGPAPYTGAQRLAFAGQITFEAVSFGYTGEPFLREVNLTLAPHTTVAILGANGSGKSTLTYLMLGLYRPQQGRLCADGVPFDALDLAHLRRQIGVVMQNPLIFPGTLWENITYGLPEATPAQVEWASRLATAHDFICDFPQGYDTAVGEHGALLSGGQRQRVALARALLRRPPLLILDEPTNHLDRSTIDQFMHNLKTLDPAPAVVFISHDHRLAQQAQAVYTLREGRLLPFAPAPQAAHGN